MENLNDLGIPDVDGIKVREHDSSIFIANPKLDSIEVVFMEIENNIIELISQYEKGLVIGCVAWLTSFPILKALGKCRNFQILVQKEDFLRPDSYSGFGKSYNQSLRNLYKSITLEDFSRYDFKDPIHSLSYASDPTCDPIRCVGNYNEDKRPAFPRSHHKFLVFCRIEKTIVDEYSNAVKYYPECLLTGSFNFTKNATQSLENVLILKDVSGENKILDAYVNEHHQSFGISEPLDWSHTWSNPEYRLET